jgi:penicillin amidase
MWRLRYPALALTVLLPAILAEVVAQPPAAKESPEAVLAKAKVVLAPVKGEIKMASLKEPVAVLRDRWGIAHIYAKNSHDLFFAQGFVAAQVRLFQIDLWRRQGMGELAEAFGPQYVEADTFARLMKYRGDMNEEWKSYAPDTKEIATAFTDGINAAIDQFGDALPIEFQLLGHRPKKWKPEDVLGRMSGIYMSQNFRNEISRARLVAAVGIDKARWLAPVDPQVDYKSHLRPDDLKAIDARVLAGYDAATKALSFQPSKRQSNNWVVSGDRSTSGKPMLASDPHRAIANPSLRYLVHLHAPGWNVIGGGEPGLPGVAIGHNDRIAWGFTIVGTDQSDIVVDELKPDSRDVYRTETGWEACEKITESIAVKGEKPCSVELRYTRHGPILFSDDKRAFSLRWAGLLPGGAAYLASLSIDRARNWEEFLQSMERWHAPGENFVYADVDGNIGWIAAAMTPVRKKHDGLLPVPGTGGFEWSGFLRTSELPQSFNPKTGWLATANHKILPDDYKHRIGFEFGAAFRFDRVRTRLTAKEKLTLDDFKSIQHDDVSIPGQTLAKLLKEVEFEDASLMPYVKLLRDWNGKLSLDSKAGPLYAIWLPELQRGLYSPHVPKDLLSTAMSLGGLPTLFAALEKPEERWFGPDPKAGRERLVRETFAAAVTKLKKLPEPKQERWGALHTVTFRHPLATRDPALAKVLNVGPFARSGDANTPNNTRFDERFNQIHGATYRHVLDLADWDRGLATSAPGQSGQPGSPHYADLAPLWAKGGYFPLAFSRGKVEEVTGNRLVLEP